MAATSNSFEGTVVGVPSSFRIVVQPRAAKAPLMTLIPACIRVPSGNDEPLSFAARDTIRKQFLGQEVHCSYVKEHARISRLQDGLEVTVSLVRAGLATCNELDRVYNDFAQHKRELIELQEAAVRRGVGIHDPCLRGASTLRRLQAFPTRKEDPLSRQQIVKAIVTSKSTFRFSVEKILTATSFAGYFMPSLQSVSVRLLGLKPPRSENAARNACQRINVKLMHRVVTVVVHGFDDDHDEFIVELTSATYKKLFGELVSQGLLLSDRTLQLPNALDAYNYDREAQLNEQRHEQLLLLKEKEQQQHASSSSAAAEAAKKAPSQLSPSQPSVANTAAPTSVTATKPSAAVGAATASGLAPAGLGADSPQSKRSPAARPKPSPQVKPMAGGEPLLNSPPSSVVGGDGGIDIAINFGTAFATDDADPFSDADADRRVAQMAADLVGDLLGGGASPNPTTSAANVGTNHAAFFATALGGDDFDNATPIGERGRILSDTNMKRFETSPEQRPAAAPQQLFVDPAIVAAGPAAAKNAPIVDSAIVAVGATVANDDVVNKNGANAAAAVAVGQEDELPMLPPPMRVEDRLPWRDRLPVKNGRFRRGLVVGVPNEVTMDILEERVQFPRGGGGRGGRRGGKNGRSNIAREFHKIHIAGLGAPAPYETKNTPEDSMIVSLPGKELMMREQLRRLLIGQEVWFYLTDANNSAPRDDGSFSAHLYVSVRELPPPKSAKDGAQPAASDPSSAATIRRGWMDVSHFCRAINDPSEIAKIQEEAANCVSENENESGNEENNANSGATANNNNSTVSAQQKAADSNDKAKPATAANGKDALAATKATPPPPPAAVAEVVEDEDPLDMFIPRAEHCLFDFNRFNRMLQRGVPTDDELKALVGGTWAVKPNLVPIAPLVPPTDENAATAAIGAAVSRGAPAAIGLVSKDATPQKVLRDTDKNVIQSTAAPPTQNADGTMNEFDNNAGDAAMLMNGVPPEEEVIPRVDINYVSSNSFVKSLLQLGNSVPARMLRQYVPGVIEEFTAPLSLSVYVPALQVQLPFELKHVHLPPLTLGIETTCTSPTSDSGKDSPTAKDAKEKDKKSKRDKKGGKKGAKESEESAATAATAAAGAAAADAAKTYPPLTDRERVVYNDISEFLEDTLVHRDCLILTEEIDTNRKCLLGSIAIPFSQLPHRWRSRLSATNGLPPLMPALDGSDEPLLDVLHALVTLGMCAVTPSRVVSSMPLDIVTQIVTAQQNARDRRLGIWDAACPTLQSIAKAPQRPSAASTTTATAASTPTTATSGAAGNNSGNAAAAATVPTAVTVESLIKHDSPRPTMRARKIIPIKRVDPVSFTFRYDDKENEGRAKELAELLKNTCRPLPRTARVHPGDLVVICKRTVKITRKKPLSRREKELERKKEKEAAAAAAAASADKNGETAASKEDANASKEKESDEIREEIVTHHRAKIASRVVNHCCRVDFVDETETDVNVHLREIRLPDEEGKIESFPSLIGVARHSFILLSDEGKKLLAAKIEEELVAAAAAKKAGGSGKAADEKEKEKEKEAEVKKDRNGRVIKTRLTRQQEKAEKLQKEFDELVSYTDNLVKKPLYMSTDYRVTAAGSPRNDVHGFIFEADKDNKGPHSTLPPGTVHLLRTCPHMLNIDVAMADESAVFVPFIRHLIDMVTGLGTANVVLKPLPQE